jgi:polysaccharide export outer membrane protein
MRIQIFMKNSLPAYWVGLVLMSLTFCSCGNTRHLVYMQGKFDTTALSQIPVKEPVFQKGDIVSIIVYSDNPEATRIYNQALMPAPSSSVSSVTPSTGGAQTGSQTIGGVSATSGGYMVDENGDIQFQGLGVLHIDGLTRSALRDTLDARLRNFLVHPYYSIRFLNYKYTMLGEVQHPGIFSIPGERISLLEALGMAGDMTFYGRRDNILVMRENNGKREWARLDITKPEVIASPYFYLQSNDVVIIEPSKKKVAASDQVTVRNISIGTTIISTLAILYSIFRKN